MVDRSDEAIARLLPRDVPIGFIGAGRLGSSLAIAMASAGYSVSALSSRRESHRNWLHSRLPNASVHDNPANVAAESRIVLITTTDTAIKQIADSISWRSDQMVVHSSGAVPLQALNGASLLGARVGGFHPMQTFPSPDSANLFQGITFGIESTDAQLFSWLSSLASDLGGQAYPLTAEQRPAYHAAAVMACGLLAGLTGLAAEIWASAGTISRQQALAALVPLVKTTANSMGENGLPQALTGPYVRGDVETVRAHIEASTAVSEELGAAYSALAIATLHMAREQGNLTPEAESSIKDMLISTLQASCERIEQA